MVSKTITAFVIAAVSLVACSGTGDRTPQTKEEFVHDFMHDYWNGMSEWQQNAVCEDLFVNGEQRAADELMSPPGSLTIEEARMVLDAVQEACE